MPFQAYKLKDFARWAKKAGLSDSFLYEVIVEMNRGLLGDRLGAHIYKKRIKVNARGKSGGARIIVLFKYGELILFLYGFLKNEQDNITEREARQLRIFSKEFLEFSPSYRESLCIKGELVVVEKNIL